MQFNNIIKEIAATDPEFPGRVHSRRSAMREFAGLGARISLAAMPLFIGSVFKKAYAQPSMGPVLEILNYALTLEYLESEFYATAITKGTALIPAGPATNAIQTISNHEAAHVSFLKMAITASGGVPVSKPNFDFTAKGTFGDVFTNYATFLAVAQTFEDTGVRAYKGRAAELVKGGDLLTAALNIHSVEARHAAHIRQMRKNNGFGDVKPWITGKDSGIGSVVQASYDGEDNTSQAGVNIVNINGQAISAAAASEAFDEGLSKDQVLAIVSPFFVS
ncbi:ferritin-like domain-containing protein [Flavihumibacter fluvii]|uniref:ferritin-like domain-containing protein n=1 Tax=Flavihumibacter fluvii TaxID=2838157 RepID=UPI001BDEC935|nr:ferritin-like domain-containing protein [Flavihumibacter fluvii]ULQ52848.1 ferritin-like domain-containing protein [Flavihumibacter fluvii]